MTASRPPRKAGKLRAPAKAGPHRTSPEQRALGRHFSRLNALPRREGTTVRGRFMVIRTREADATYWLLRRRAAGGEGFHDMGALPRPRPFYEPAEPIRNLRITVSPVSAAPGWIIKRFAERWEERYGRH